MNKRRCLLCHSTSRPRHINGLGTLCHLCADWHRRHSLLATRQQIARLDAEDDGQPWPAEQLALF
jgi:hypothetical protein